MLTAIGSYGQALELSPLSKVSVLTSGSGNVLYSAFGHSAFRVQDPTLGIDVVYNYGVFDTSGENFYWKFSQGRMDYKLVRERFERYLNGYKIEDRWVKEQILNLSLAERIELFKFLEHNNLPQNKIYSYDYFSNNCATKIWDVLKSVLKEKLIFNKKYIQEQYSFRELVHHNIKTNSWGAFGIDVALGSVIDRKATPKEHMYLPDYIFRQLKAAKLNGAPLVKEEVLLYKSKNAKQKSNFLTSPLFFFLIVSVLILSITYVDFKRKKRSRVLDFCILLVTGLAGVVLFFLWFMTDHIWTVKNFNILWTFPFSLIFAFAMLHDPIPIIAKKYLLVLIGLILLMSGLWLFRVQEFSFVIIPLLISLIVRYYYVWRYAHNTPSSL